MAMKWRSMWAAGFVVAALLVSAGAHAQGTVQSVVQCPNTTTGVNQPCNGVTDSGLPVKVSAQALPSGAATATNQEVTPAGTTATSAQGVQGVTGGVPVPVSGAFGFAPLAVTSTQTGFTITAGGTFQTLAASNTSRKSCTIQNTSAHTMLVFFGLTASALLTNSLQISPLGSISCANVNGTVLTDNIAVETSTTNDTGVLNLN
jgi:hypothetical protein